MLTTLNIISSNTQEQLPLRLVMGSSQILNSIKIVILVTAKNDEVPIKHKGDGVLTALNINL